MNCYEGKNAATNTTAIHFSISIFTVSFCKSVIADERWFAPSFILVFTSCFVNSLRYLAKLE